ncbi:MATE family efflux transporter [Alteromonas gilva]|uniref:MATE family efflux transporter n=1 Tax=Alteromonas gilva TaxID=2987522 RepID=A0ABT5L3J8_9ALTE|nr:MATE family efflux transporter [Alteromonas gilva]MDC8831612.1 MATE family efflux transporter [Alteromonas gilva]
MTVPVIIGMVMMMSFGLIDTFFVSLLGTEQLAAISFTFPVTFTLISLNIGLGIGTSAVIAKLAGQGNQDNARETGTGAIMLSVLMVGILALVGGFSINFTFELLGAQSHLLPYIHDYMAIWYFSSVFLAIPMVGNSVLRARGDTKTPSIIMATGGGINALLDPMLIFGFGPIPAMGIGGAALATLISWIVCSVWVLYLLAKQRGYILPRLLSLPELAQSGRAILPIALPAAGANMLTPVAGAILTRVVAGYGEEAVAAWGVGNRLESFTSIVVLALSMSLPPFISQNLGAQRIERVKSAYWLIIKFVLGWQLLICVLLWLTSGLLAALFAKEQAVAELIQLFLIIVPLGYGLQGIVILTNSSLNAMHLPMTALVLSVVRLFVFFVPITVLMSLYLDLQGIFIGAVVANFLMAMVSVYWFRRSLHSLTDEHKQTEVN